jgi:DDE superfamily endonuclease
MLPGTPERATHDYKRSGTSSLYAALDISTGKVIGSLHSPPSRDRVQEVSADPQSRVPADLDVHLILDNASTHKTPAIQKWLVAHRSCCISA